LLRHRRSLPGRFSLYERLQLLIASAFADKLEVASDNVVALPAAAATAWLRTLARLAIDAGPSSDIAQAVRDDRPRRATLCWPSIAWLRRECTAPAPARRERSITRGPDQQSILGSRRREPSGHSDRGEYCLITYCFASSGTRAIRTRDRRI
jgi:hypothetical protein